MERASGGRYGGVVRKDERGGWREGRGWTRRWGRRGRRRWWGRRRLWWQIAGIRERFCIVAMWSCPCLLITRLAEKESGSSWRKGHTLEWIPCPRRACYIEVNGVCETELDDEDQISERTSKILAAHHANSLDWIRGGSKGDRRRGKGSGRKCGLLGNNFTVALIVQLWDPLRNYEPVSAPMLVLIQVERVFVPPKPRIYLKVSEVKYENEEDESAESKKKEEIKEGTEEKKSEVEEIPQYKITEVHVAGLKTDPGKRKVWGSSNQQQSGSRRLLANGMGKSNKHPFLKSKTASSISTAPATTKAQPGDTLEHLISCSWNWC